MGGPRRVYQAPANKCAGCAGTKHCNGSVRSCECKCSIGDHTKQREEPERNYTRESDQFIDDLNKKWKKLQEARGPR